MSGAGAAGALERLARGEPVSPAELAAALHGAAGTLGEGRALDALGRAARRGPLPEDVALLGARLCALRGDAEAGLGLLAGQRSPAAARLRAELAGAGAPAAPVDPTAEGDEPLPLPPPSTRFPALRIGDELGRGGAAAVYVAEDGVLGRRVALKLYHRARAHREQLTREARLAVAVAGPGVVPVLDVDPDHGALVLALARGGSLARLFLKDVADEGEAAAAELEGARWLAGLVAALERVHAAGLVHGDLKPANVLLDRGAPWLADFGVAVPAGGRRLGGTVGYQRPESGPVASPADDWYALGRILAELGQVLAPRRPAAGARWSAAAESLVLTPTALVARALARGPEA